MDSNHHQYQEDKPTNSGGDYPANMYQHEKQGSLIKISMFIYLHLKYSKLSFLVLNIMSQLITERSER